jgi:hypothetical protein
MDNNIKSIKRIISNTARPIPNRYQINKFLSPPYSGMVREVWDFVEKSSSIYLGFGGCGDALLTLASAYKDNDAKVVFFANPTSSPLILQFYELFNTKIVTISGYSFLSARAPSTSTSTMVKAFKNSISDFRVP